MKTMHYYQHHIGDFIKATARLTDGQAMAYLRLLWMYYDTEKPLKPDTQVLAFQIGATIEETDLLLNSFFWLAENGWHHTRCDQEIADYKAFLAKKSNAGKASAERRKNSSATSVEQVLNECATTEQLTTNHITTNQKNTATIVATPIGVSDSVWQDFKTLRKAKKAPITQRAIDGIKAEADKAGWSMEQALSECCIRGWQAFKAEWVAPKPTFADIAKVTVPSKTERDPALVKLDEDKARTGPPPAEIRAQIMQALKGKVK